MTRAVLVAVLVGWASLGLIGLSLSAMAQERITLTTPESYPSNAQYRVHRVVLDVESAEISIALIGQRGEKVSCLYSGTTTPTGSTLLTGLNKANLSTGYAGNATTGSLIQRIFHRLGVLGESATVCNKAIVGTLTGSVP